MLGGWPASGYPDYIVSEVAARIVDGEALARRNLEQTAEDVRALRAEGRHVSLDVVMVGDPSAGAIYARSQREKCERLGIDYRMHAMPADADEAAIRDEIRRLNEDPAVTGILLNLPLPAGIDTHAMQFYIDPYKDVEGVSPANIGLLFYDTPIMAPCTALAVMEVLREAGVGVRGLNAVVVGQGAIAGRPISLFLAHEMATVTGCHIATRDLAEHTRLADVLIVAVGKPGLIGAEHIKPGAVVIDVGINRIKGADGKTGIVGDVLFDEVRRKASVVTPVPGGVGPVTVAMLLRSTVEAARKQLLTPRRIDT